MNASENFWYRTLFKIKVYETFGDAFQKLFQDIMTYHHDGFQSIAPWGNWGDGGNDGWIQDEGRYFQVYGPKASKTTFSITEILNKAIGDFGKLQEKWFNIQNYHFVYNDRFEGIPAPLASELASLKSQQNLSESGAWSAGKLEKLFIELSDDEKMSIIGGIPAEIPSSIDSSAIGEVLKALADSTAMLPTFLNEQAPGFQEKIEFNGLNSQISNYLQYYSYQTQDVDDFFITRPSLAQTVASEIKNLYQQSKGKIRDSSSDAPNIRYVWMVEKLIPGKIKSHPHSLKAYREAAQVILAKYFESCDAYEHP